MSIKYKTNSPLNLIGGLKYCSKFDTHKQRKGILIFGKNILRESKNVLVELLSKGEIDRIDEIK